MTDVETLIIARLDEIRDNQIKTDSALVAHMASDIEVMGKLQLTLASAKGRVIGFVSGIGLVSGGLGAGASLFLKYWMGW